MAVKLIEYPDDQDWLAVKNRALVTVGKHSDKPPTSEWKHKILEARHSPIRRLHFSFYISDLPYWVSTELSRHHEGCQPYIKSQRNDRQSEYDRNTARQDAPVDMIWDLNAEALMTIANKRLCLKATPEAREVVADMCELAEEACPELHGLLVRACEFYGGCHEMNPYDCGWMSKWGNPK